MKRLKAGPELKMPDLRNLKFPAFLEDLYYDLKDRRLLPLVALGIVAIIAVPFLLSGGSSEDKTPAALPSGGSQSASASGAEASLTVVKSTPGLRDYRKRLRQRSPTDPFKQRFTAPQLAGAQLGPSPGEEEVETPSPSSTTTTSSTTTQIESTSTQETTRTSHSENGVVTTETETQTSPSAPSSGGSEGNPGTGGSESRWIGFAIDVRVKTAVTLPDGTVEADEPVNITKVRAPAPLPTEKTAVVSYLGANFKTGNLVFLVSDEVTSVFGEAKCLSGTQTCQLLEVETGVPTTFVYGSAAERFKITVTKIERIPIELPKNLEQSAESP